MDREAKRAKAHIVVLYASTCFNFLLFTVLFGHLYLGMEELDERFGVEQASFYYAEEAYDYIRILKYSNARNDSDDQLRPRIGRRAKRTAAMPEDSIAEDEWLLTPNSVIEPDVLKTYCATIKSHCASRQRGLRAAPGQRGPKGKQGFPGPGGIRGNQGLPGPNGSIGLVGEEGPMGENGTCICDFPDFITPPMSPVEITGPAGQGLAPQTGKVPSGSGLGTTHVPYTGPPTLGPKQRKCTLEMVGTPILHAESQFGRVGAWMRDSSGPTDDEPATLAHKRWVMPGWHSPVLYQYASERELQKKRQETRYYIQFLSVGTGILVHNGNLYYHQHDSPNIIKYDLTTTINTKRRIPGMAFHDCARNDDFSFEKCNKTNRDDYLYDLPHNFADLASDENGLWVIYHFMGEDELSVSKLDFEDLYIVQTWKLKGSSIKNITNAFVICGKLYGIQSRKLYETKISYAYDLYEDVEEEVDVEWHNPYEDLTMVDYNPRDKRIHFFDANKMLTVPVKVGHY